MKIYKLLILLLAVTGLHSCTEYLDNGKNNTGPEPGEVPEFVAGLADESIKYYVGDTVVLKATLNDVDVTSTTIFKVNGIELKRDYNPKNGNIYVAKNIGEHSVVATLDDFMDSFTFTILKKEGEEPTGNRIEYENKAYPVSETLWILHVEDGEPEYFKDEDDNLFTLWGMISSEYDSNDEVLHQFVTFAYIPLDGQNIALPYQAAEMIHVGGGYVTINGNDVFNTGNVIYNFAGTGNTMPDFNSTPPVGTANYTGLATGQNKEAELFWEGDYYYLEINLTGSKGAKAKNTKSLISDIQSLPKSQIKNLKITK